MRKLDDQFAARVIQTPAEAEKREPDELHVTA